MRASAPMTARSGWSTCGRAACALAAPVAHAIIATSTARPNLKLIRITIAVRLRAGAGDADLVGARGLVAALLAVHPEAQHREERAAHGVVQEQPRARDVPRLGV